MEQGRRIFITVPEDSISLKPAKHHGDGGFVFNAAIPLPVELAPGETEFKAADLQVEMILSGILWELAENPEGANAAYYRALVNAVKPGILEELNEAAILKAGNGDYEAALEIFSLLEGLYPRLPVLLLNKALVLESRAGALERAGRSEEAEKSFPAAEAAYEAALALPLPDTLINAAFFYERRGDYRRCAGCLKAYLEETENMETENAETGTENAEDDAGLRDKRARAQALLEDIAENGLDDDAFMEAIALIRGGSEEAGILKAKEFLERRPGAGNGWFVLGWGLRRLARWDDAASCFEKAVEQGTANADTRNELAICRMELGDYNEARRQLEKALNLDPENIKIISNLGILAAREGSDDKAAAFFRTVLELEPEDPVALEYFR